MTSAKRTGVKFLRKAADFAGSRSFSVFVLIMSVTYVLILAVFGLLVDTRWLDILSGLLPFQLLYVLFFLNLILFEIKWLPAVLRRCNKTTPAQSVERLGQLGHAREVAGSGLRVGELALYLKRRGYQVGAGTQAGDWDGRGPATVLLHAGAGRFSPLGNLLFHAGFFLILLGAVTNVLYRFEGTAIIAEGSAFTGVKKEYRSTGGAAAATLPEVDFDVEKISADFWDGKLLFTRLEAALVHRGGRDTAKLSSAARVGNAAVTISGYGYVPMFVLRNKSGEILDQAYVKLNIFSPGIEDYFYVREYPHKIFVSFYPDYAQVDGKIVNKSMNPVNPAYFLRILRGRIPVYTGFVKPGEWAEYDGLSISFPSFVKSADFLIVRNPGHPFIWAAFVMMGFGLAWRLLFYRKEVALWRDDAGRTWLAGRSDYHPMLHAQWLASLAEKFKGDTA